MVQYYTLEQAAQVLQTSPEKLREMVRQNKVRAFQDRGTLRFRAQEIDEMARIQGVGSDPGLPLGEVSKPSSSARRRTQQAAAPPPHEEEPTDDLNLLVDDDQAVPLGGPPSGKTKSSPSSSTKRKTPPGKSSKLNPAAKASDSDVRLVPDGSSMEFELSLDDDPPAAKSPAPRPRQSRIAPASSKPDSDVRIDSLAQGKDSDVKMVPDDSDTDNEAVPLGQSRAKTPSDSDIRMEVDDLSPGVANPNRPGSDPLVTEEIDLDLEALEQDAAAKSKPPSSKPPSSKRSKAQPAKPPSKTTNLPTTSPFELSEMDIPVSPASPTPRKAGKALEESSSDFELTLDPSSPIGSEEPPLSLDDEEVGLGELSGSTGTSGINLDAPVDSGISLEADGSDEMEFELSLDDGSASGKPSSGKGKSSAPPEDSEFELSLDDGETPAHDSDSEFELTLDDSGSSELALEGTDAESASGSDSEFELTLDEDGGLSHVEETSDLAEEDEGNLFESDFDVPSLDDESGSEAVALEESSSEFDLQVDDSVEMEAESDEGEIVHVGEGDESDEGNETQAREAAEEGEEEVEFDDLGEGAAETDLDDEGVVRTGPVRYAEAPPTEWGVFPALVLLPCVIVLFFVGLMGFETIQGMWGYHKGTKISGMLIHPLAKMFDENLPKE